MAGSNPLLIVADAVEGGLGEAVREEARWFRELGWDVSVAAPAGKRHPGHSDDAVVAIPDGLRDVSGARAASQQLRQLHAAIDPMGVHCHGARAFVIAMMAGIRRPVVTHHGFGRSPRETLRNYASRAMAMRLIPRLSSAAFSAAVDVPGRWQFEPIRSPLLAVLDPELPLEEEGVPTFAWLGRLAPPKRPDMFVRALSAISREVPVRGLIAGDGADRTALEALAASSGSPVEFLGWVETETVLSRARATVLTSGFEAVSFAVQEAMWCGRSAVVSPLPSLQWLCGDDGLFASTEADVELHVRRLLNDDVAALRGSEARRRIHSLMAQRPAWEQVRKALTEEVA